MIASTDAATYSVLLLDLLLRYQMIANRRKNSQFAFIDIYSQSKPVLQYCIYIYTMSVCALGDCLTSLGLRGCLHPIWSCGDSSIFSCNTSYL